MEKLNGAKKNSEKLEEKIEVIKDHIDEVRIFNKITN
jgi:hypothetical protein